MTLPHADVDVSRGRWGPTAYRPWQTRMITRSVGCRSMTLGRVTSTLSVSVQARGVETVHVDNKRGFDSETQWNGIGAG